MLRLRVFVVALCLLGLAKRACSDVETAEEEARAGAEDNFPGGDAGDAAGEAAAPAGDEASDSEAGQ